MATSLNTAIRIPEIRAMLAEESDDFDEPLPVFCVERRCAHLRRILQTTELIRQFRFGCTAEFINREVNERSGDGWCLRTTYRDLTFLVECAVVEEVVSQNDRTGFV
jgi:hypothetical protein